MRHPRHHCQSWLALLWWGLLTALLLTALAAAAKAGPADSVVRLTSHGGSGTVIFTEPGRSLILSCGHCFQGADRRKRLVIDAPAPAPGSPQSGGARVLAVDHQRDLALIELRAGPLPYVAAVAPRGFQPPAQLLSVGYDDQTWHAQDASRAVVRPATVLSSDRTSTYTRELPWHGRSGGGLIDPASGQLVGVVSGYGGNASPRNWAEVRPGCRGIYVSLDAICDFLGQAQPGRPWVQEYREPRGCPDCPGGLCPLPGR